MAKFRQIWSHWRRPTIEILWVLIPAPETIRKILLDKINQPLIGKTENKSKKRLAMAQLKRYINNVAVQIICIVLELSMTFLIPTPSVTRKKLPNYNKNLPKNDFTWKMKDNKIAVKCGQFRQNNCCQMLWKVTQGSINCPIWSHRSHHSGCLWDQHIPWTGPHPTGGLYCRYIVT